MKTQQEIFTHIYKTNAWKSDESSSGPSSTLERTNTLRAALPVILKKYAIKSIIDSPCGDFNWMKHVMPIYNITYTGIDIVEPMIETNNQKYSSENVRFKCIDVLDNSIPSSHFIFCRDFLFHLSYADIAKFFGNVIDTRPDYFMTTSHINKTKFENMDIRTGGWRWFDLFQEPFNFPSNYKEAVLDGGGDRYMYFWRLRDIKKTLRKFESRYSTQPKRSRIQGFGRLINLRPRQSKKP